MAQLDFCSTSEMLWRVVSTSWVPVKFFWSILVLKSKYQSFTDASGVRVCVCTDRRYFRCHLFGSSIENQQNAYNHYRLYGSVLLLILGIIVFLGIKIVSRIGRCACPVWFVALDERFFSLAPFTLLVVLLSILSIFVGIIKSAISPTDLPLCIIEKNSVKHLLKSSLLKNDVGRYCHGNTTCDNEPCPLRQAFCDQNISQSITCADIDHVYQINGIPGLSQSLWKNNLKSMHMQEGEVIPGSRGKPSSF